MRKLNALRAVLPLLFLCIAAPLFSQVIITGGTTVSQDFTTIGTSGTAALPQGWKADAQLTARLVGTYAAAGSSTTQVAGANMSSSASNGIYNYGAGTTASGTDRAVGGLSSGTSSKTVNVYVDLLNNGASVIPGLTLSYNVEKYRTGTNAAGYSLQLYYSADGSTWTSAGASFLTSFPADATTSGYATAPGVTTAIAAQPLPVSIAAGSHLYLAWSYSVSSGSTTTNAQGLGIDDVVITAASSADARLSGISLSAGTLSPVFNASTLDYTASVSNSINSITVTPTAADAGATIQVNNHPVTSGSPTDALTLTEGANTIDIVVTAADGTTARIYTVTVTRLAASTPVLSTDVAPADFGPVCLHTSQLRSFTFSGADLDGSDIALTGPAGYLFSETQDGDYTDKLTIAYTGTGFSARNVFVQLTPENVQSYNGLLSLSGGGVNSYAVSVSGSGINTQPSVSTGGASLSTNTATLNGSILSSGCGVLTAYGIEYSTVSGFANGSGTPLTASGLSGSSFSVALPGLVANTTYYYKAFASNSGGTSYGSQQSLTVPATPLVLADQPFLSYVFDFSDIASWSTSFGAGSGDQSHFSPVAINATGSIPDGVRITTGTGAFTSGTSGGVQKGTGSILLLSTGSTDNSTSAAFDLHLDFTGVNAASFGFDWASVNNSTGDRNGSLRVYASANGTSFTELPAAAVLNVTNNSPSSGTVSEVALPSSFNNNPDARLRFYYYNGTGGTTGSRPKISIDHIAVNAVSTTPCATPAAPPSALVFSGVTDSSVIGSFTAASPAVNEYLVVMSTSNALTSGPVDGQIYNAGDNVGDGTVISRGPSLQFNAQGLQASTSYTFFVFPLNSVCLGGPLYLTTNVLTDEVSTSAGLMPCSAPEDQPSLLGFSSISTNAIKGSFSAAAADQYLVIRSQQASLSEWPVNGKAYNPGDVLGNGTVVQEGAATTFTASSLAPGSLYYFYVFAANAGGCLNGPAYNTIAPLQASAPTNPLPVCTTPVSQPASLSFHATNTVVSGTFNAAPGDYDYLVVRSTAGSLSGAPVDNTEYAPGASLGGGIVVANGSSTSFAATGLDPSTTYYFFIFSVNRNCTGGTKYLADAPLTGSTATTDTPPNHYYFGNLHAHSDYSDGNQDHPGFTPADDYNYALGSLGMDFLGISEHNHFSSPDNPGNILSNYHLGLAQADSFTAHHPGFLALYGMEWGVISGGGHVVVYGDGLNDLFGWESDVNGIAGPNYDVYVPKSVYTGPLGLFRTINSYIGKNTFATLAHPNSTDYNNLSNLAYDPVADSAIVGTAVESGPSTSTNTSYSNPASPMAYLWYYQKMLSRGYHLGPVIDHDNHKTTFGRTTYSRTAVIAPALTKTDLVRAMRDMHFYATEDVDCQVDFRVNSQMMGSTFTDRNAPAISVSLNDPTTSTANAVIRIMYGIPGSNALAVKIDSATGSSLYFVDDALPNNTTAYYYADISLGNARIITSPIWYTRTCLTTGDTVATACDQFTWYGTTYTASGTARHQMTTAAGCDSIITLHLTIHNSPAAPPVNAQTFCSGAAPAVQSLPQGDGRYTWYDAAEGGTALPLTGAVSTASYYVTEKADGCESPRTAVAVTVNQSPQVNAGVYQPLCENGQPLALQGTPAGGAWSGSGVTGNSADGYVFDPAAGTQTLNYAVTENGCTSSEQVSLTVYAKPDVSVQADGPTAFCPGGSVRLTSSGAVTYLWSTGATEPTILVSQSGNYSVTVTDAHGCSAASVDMIVYAEDHEAPVVHTRDLTIMLDGSGHASITAAEVNNGSTDNCSIGANGYLLDRTSFSCEETGAQTVTLTVTDVNGNSASATATITVRDTTAPLITSCPVVGVQCFNAAGYTIPAITAVDNCGVTGYRYVITGATSRSGQGSNASGSFAVGTSTITWTATDASGNESSCITTVRVDAPLFSTIPDVYALSKGTAPNTLYTGYGPSSLTLNANVTGGTPSPGYSYKWTTSSSAGPAQNNTASFTVSPSSATTYYLNVKDAFGCAAVATTRTIEVLDVRCGPKLDKVSICVLSKGSYSTSCVNASNVSGYLSQGATLGACLSGTSTMMATGRDTAVRDGALSLEALPNPSQNEFSLLIRSSQRQPLTLKVMDAVGHVMEIRSQVPVSGTVRIGSGYRPGIYFLEVTQGNQRAVIRLVKRPG